MKICLVGPYRSDPGENGTAALMRELNASLLKRGHSTHIITLSTAGPKDALKNVGSFLYILLSWLRGLNFVIFGVLRILMLNSREHFDVLHGFMILPSGLVAVLCGKITGIPVIVTSVGSDIEVMPKFFGYKMLILWTARLANRLICLTKSLKRAAMNIGISGKKIDVIPKGVDFDNFDTEIPSFEARMKLGLSEKLRVILFVGRLVSVKRVDRVIRAFKKVLVDTPDACLLIVGDGPLKPSLERLSFELGVEDYVRFEGPISYKDINVYYSACDVFVLTSISEGLPATILEAMASRRPVISTAVGGIPELITNDVNGILIDREDKDALATSINLLLSSPSKYESIAKQGFKTLKEYDWRTIVTKIEKTYYLSINK